MQKISRLIFMLYFLCAFEVFNGTSLFFFQQLFLAIAGCFGLLFFIKKNNYKNDILSLALLMLILNVINLRINYNIGLFESLNNSLRFLFPFSIMLFRPLIRSFRGDWFVNSRNLFLMYTIVIIFAFYLVEFESYKNILFSVLIAHSIANFYEKKSFMYVLYVFFYSVPIFARDIQRGLLGVFLMIIFVELFRKSSRNLKQVLVLAIIILTIFSVIEVSSIDLDASINNRLNNIVFLLSTLDWQILVHGYGYLTNNIKEAYFDLGHFYISDLGIIGVVWTYGIFGIYVYFVFLRKYFASRDINMHKNVLLLFLLLHGIYTGYMVHNMLSYLIISEIISSRGKCFNRYNFS